MVTQDKQPKQGVNPKGTGPAQPKDIEEPHPSDEEGYSRQGRPGGAGNAASTDGAKQRKEGRSPSESRTR